jgi:hypothetical protein
MPTLAGWRAGVPTPRHSSPRRPRSHRRPKNLSDVWSELDWAHRAVPGSQEAKRRVALGSVGARVLEAGTIFICVVSLLSVVSLRQAGVGAEGLITAQALVDFHDWIMLLGQGLIPAVNALLLGSLLYQSRLVPRVLPVLGFIGAPLLAASFTATLFDAWGQVSALSLFLTIQIAVWEFSLGVYLIVKGFSPRRSRLAWSRPKPGPPTPSNRRRASTGSARMCPDPVEGSGRRLPSRFSTSPTPNTSRADWS